MKTGSPSDAGGTSVGAAPVSRSAAKNAASARSRLDKSAYEPAYVQIANILADDIAGGTYRPGSQLPTEAQLCDTFEVSPMTIRRAVKTLVDRGLVSTTRGKGTFVRPLDLSQAVFRLEGLSNNWLTDVGVEVHLLEASIVPATEQVAGVLACVPEERTVYLRRLLERDATPVAYHRQHLVYDPHRPLVEAQLEISSLEGLLRSAGSEGLPTGDLTIEAVSLGQEAAELLKRPLGSAGFSLEHLFYDFESRPVSWGWFLCPADQFRLRTRIGAGTRTARK